MVAATLLMSLGVVLLLGFVVIRAGTQRPPRDQGTSRPVPGRRRLLAAQDEAAAAARPPAGTDGDDTPSATSRSLLNWRSDLVVQLASGGAGAFDVVALSSDTAGSAPSRGARASGGVRIESIPVALREAVSQSSDTHQTYTRIQYADGQHSEPGLVIGKRLNDVDGNAYELYYLFPFTQEEASLTLVKTTIATAGLFVVGLLGAIAWLVVRQVVTPVRMARASPNASPPAASKNA